MSIAVLRECGSLIREVRKVCDVPGEMRPRLARVEQDAYAAADAIEATGRSRAMVLRTYRDGKAILYKAVIGCALVEADFSKAFLYGPSVSFPTKLHAATAMFSMCNRYNDDPTKHGFTVSMVDVEHYHQLGDTIRAEDVPGFLKRLGDDATAIQLAARYLDPMLAG